MSGAEQQPKASAGLLKSSMVVSTFTFLSRILGLIRDVVLARFLGADANADAFIVAFKIPNFMRRLFAEGAFAQAFVPVLSEYREQGSHAAVRQLLNAVAGCLGSTLILLTVLVVAGAPLVTMLFAPGFYMEGGERYALASDMIRITFPYLLLISLTGFAGAILNSYDRFAVPAFTPVLLNICLIAAAIYLSPYFERPVMALAWGVLAAGVVQLLFQLPFLYQLRLLPYPAPNWKDSGVRRILALMAPAIFGVSVSQINLLLDTVLASLLPLGSVTWLYFSDRLAELPLGVFGIAVATVILPSLSRQHSADKPEQFSATMDWALRLVLLIAVPAALALILLAEPILTTLFQYGKYSAEDILMASWSLRAYAFGLVAFMLIKILAPGYFSRQDTKTPVKYGIIAMVSNMALNIAFVWPLYTYMNLGHVGLALATSCSAFINAGLLLSGLRRDRVYRAEPGWWAFALRMLVANVAMAAVLLYLNAQWQDWYQWGWWQRTYTMLALVLAGLCSYALVLVLAGVRPKHLKQKKY
ncbi:murein biosynthesis integral membrane protein MurJ [Pseudoteredinibacter isoporae]|uniref:murein biosynthesis integral membrane protein MurJ n=1 Tax=Pseudoteredinibacter isoporae TaxID=570281 RepID=UPI00333E5D75